ncbi:hypothetical protein N7539_001358 [Penicillium diatomitis]|uniref:Uncharacterized protein n=1 Tax=Penicillium diatomitis TaxID=2819901 RepID=A0A9W9XGK5_9EURO|nr:uncharacterized protein N7539_001358 [Penicillium diatomitis]KAJ5492612.1 hypothetical protein N7539_001358 [Penicillium diatomitis]
MVHEEATQHICLTIFNHLKHGNITIRNLITLSGQPYAKIPTLRILSTDEIAKICIAPGQSKVISFCGAGALGVGVEGMVDLCVEDENENETEDESKSESDSESRITTLYWNGPWERRGNQFHAASTDRMKYSVVTSLPPDEGVLGYVSVEVGEVTATAR